MYIEKKVELSMPPRRRGFWAWVQRWLLCGYRDERRIKKIYMEIHQGDLDDTWDANI